MNTIQQRLSQLPKVDEVLGDSRIAEYLETTSRTLVVDVIREVISRYRQQILQEGESAVSFDVDNFFHHLTGEIEERKKRSLRRVINGTGTILHTNLGRARLSVSAFDALQEASMGYSNLEYDVRKGERGSRHDHVELLLRQLTGAEAALAVNNNAAATMLCLSAMAKDREVIVSRGELVEIGGSFRIPDIMASSGAILREVGTTNKTRLSDYADAIGEETGVLMKVHTSNYRIVGFTSEVALKDLAKLGKESNLPVIYDMGNGLMTDLSGWGIDEPTVLSGLDDGADVILFSGDKLLGGPQAGIIAGKKEYIEKMKKHPLARVVRMDKLTIAALEATLREYLDEAKALQSIPVLRMITEPAKAVKERGIRLLEETGRTDHMELQVVPVQEQIGGGSAPSVVLDGFAVTIKSRIPAERIERQLRKQDIPIIARVTKGCVYIDMRTVGDDEIRIIAEALRQIDREVQEQSNRRMREEEDQ